MRAGPSADVAQALVPAVSRLVSTRFRTKSVTMSGDAAGRSACGAGNRARSRLSGGFLAGSASPRDRGCRLKAGCSQDWLPHNGAGGLL
jgi:hypothetical protein